jgi:hypothetical protein
MKLPFVIVAAWLLFPMVAQADSGDDTLAYFLSKSELVVIGTLKDEPVGVFTENGVPNYVCDFAVSDVLKGDNALRGKTIRVNIVRFEDDEKDRHPLIKKDAECIVFLKKQSEGTIPRWATADFWFGLQYPSPWMAKSLKRLAKLP